jgi:hypothetical protein
MRWATDSRPCRFGAEENVSKVHLRVWSPIFPLYDFGRPAQEDWLHVLHMRPDWRWLQCPYTIKTRRLCSQMSSLYLYRLSWRAYMVPWWSPWADNKAGVSCPVLWKLHFTLSYLHLRIIWHLSVVNSQFIPNIFRSVWKKKKVKWRYTTDQVLGER